MLTGLIGRRVRAHFVCGWLKKTVPRALCFSVGHPIIFFGSRAVGSGGLFPFPDPSIHDLHWTDHDPISDLHPILPTLNPLASHESACLTNTYLGVQQPALEIEVPSQLFT
jgi:hypothetical protein